MAERDPDGSAASQLSVVIPAYNYARFLPEAIESVLAQTLSSLELIVVDDGSTDETKQVVERFDDPRVRYVWQSNQGLSAARNTGIREARGELVAFLDADDRWRPDFAETVVARFEKCGPDFGMICTGFSRIDENGRALPENRHLTADGRWNAEISAREFCLRNQPISSSVVIRRAVFEECGMFDTTMRSSEDRDMWIRIASRYRCWAIDQPLVQLRKHSKSMSRNAPRMEQHSRAVLMRAWRASAVPRWNAIFWLQAGSVHFLVSAWTHHHQGLNGRALAYLAASVLCWPFFARPARIREPLFFRLRFLVHMVRGLSGNRA